MKLTIEINDSALRAAVEGEVGKAIAAMAEDTIKKTLDTILESKLERIAKNLVNKSDRVLVAEVSKVLDGVMGNQAYNKAAYVKSIVTEVALDKMKAVM